MVFRIVGATAALVIGLAWPDGQARAQYSPLRRSAQLPPAGTALQPAEQQYGLRPPEPIGPKQDVTGTLGGRRSQMTALPRPLRLETGPQKKPPPQFRRTLVNYRTKEPSGTIIIDTANTYLYLVLGKGKALRYGIGVGREGFTWAGTETISRMAEWPDWRPPQEMIDRQPYLPRFMASGPGNPLGARALYLGKTVYRIHGTNRPSTIGTFVSSGCIRLTNHNVMDLYTRVHVGTRVVVLSGRAPQTAAASPVGPAVKVRPQADVPLTR
jgi:lipoprotein-anchoring transpeptidase ErfK/SrfK